ncbi:hypothetical protein NA78x_001573 [Anatilimnocola sp. NA78]|uniref:hypothetical protein n=1 Tax=Anatilimnocola sp. NA78 TaxID=3415683 RepID=UPI003CE4EB7F
MRMDRCRAPLIFAIVLLLLPVLYVGSYLALVNVSADEKEAFFARQRNVGAYRVGSKLASRFFWPLEQIDRKVRPEAWSLYDLIEDSQAVSLPRL